MKYLINLSLVFVVLKRELSVAKDGSDKSLPINKARSERMRRQSIMHLIVCFFFQNFLN